MHITVGAIVSSHNAPCNAKIQRLPLPRGPACLFRILRTTGTMAQYELAKFKAEVAQVEQWWKVR